MSSFFLAGCFLSETAPPAVMPGAIGLKYGEVTSADVEALSWSAASLAFLIVGVVVVVVVSVVVGRVVNDSGIFRFSECTAITRGGVATRCVGVSGSSSSMR